MVFSFLSNYESSCSLCGHRSLVDTVISFPLGLHSANELLNDVVILLQTFWRKLQAIFHNGCQPSVFVFLLPLNSLGRELLSEARSSWLLEGHSLLTKYKKSLPQ